MSKKVRKEIIEDTLAHQGSMSKEESFRLTSQMVAKQQEEDEENKKPTVKKQKFVFAYSNTTMGITTNNTSSVICTVPEEEDTTDHFCKILEHVQSIKRDNPGMLNNDIVLLALNTWKDNNEHCSFSPKQFIATYFMDSSQIIAAE